MTLQTTIADIDELYPVAGVDNNTQGFRDNFAAIKNSLSLVDSELNALQNNTVKVADLETNDPVENDLQGSSIVNGYYSNFHGLTYITPAISVISTATTNIDLGNGPLQVFTLNAVNIAESLPFTFASWPGDPSHNYYAQVKAHFLSNTTEPNIPVDELSVGKKYTIANMGNTNQTTWNEIAGTTGIVYSVGSVFVAEQNGTGTGTAKQWREVTLHSGSGSQLYLNDGLTLPLYIDPNGSHTVIEAWSYDGGENIFIRSLGSYASAN